MRLGPEIHLEHITAAAAAAAAAAASAAAASWAGSSAGADASAGSMSVDGTAATAAAVAAVGGAGALGAATPVPAVVARTAADPTWRAACRAHALGTAVWRNYAVLRLLAALLITDMHPSEEADLIAHCGPPPLHGLPCGEHCSGAGSSGSSGSSGSGSSSGSGGGGVAAGGAGAGSSDGHGHGLCTGRCHTAASVTALSFWLSSILPLPQAVETRLLETTSLGERLWLLLQALWPRYGEQLGFPGDGDAAASYVECGDETPAVHARLAEVERSLPARRAAKLAAYAEAAAAERRRRVAEAEAASLREEERWLGEQAAWLAAEGARVGMLADPTARAAAAAELTRVHGEHASRVAHLRARQAAAAAAYAASSSSSSSSSSGGAGAGPSRSSGAFEPHHVSSTPAAPAVPPAPPAAPSSSGPLLSTPPLRPPLPPGGMPMPTPAAMPIVSSFPQAAAPPAPPVPPGLPFWINPATLAGGAASGRR